MSSSPAPLHVKIVSIKRQIPHQHKQGWQSVQSWQQVHLEGTQHFFSSMPPTVNGTFKPLTHILPSTVAPSSGANCSQNANCLADTACHFAALLGKPVALQFWFQLSEEKGLSSASRSAPEISPPLGRESSLCPLTELRPWYPAPEQASFSKIF